MPFPPEQSPPPRLRPWAQLWSRLVAIARALVHAPDYDRYLAHHAEHHPKQTVLTRAEFFTQRQTARFARGSSRCC